MTAWREIATKPAEKPAHLTERDDEAETVTG